MTSPDERFDNSFLNISCSHCGINHATSLVEGIHVCRRAVHDWLQAIAMNTTLPMPSAFVVDDLMHLQRHGKHQWQ